MNGLSRAAGIALLGAVFAFSCASGGDQRGGPPGGGPGPARSRGQGEAELSLLRLKGLIEAGKTDESLALTDDQATAILPLLKAWKAKGNRISASDAKAYAASIDAALTESQLAFRPAPPGGARSGAPAGGPQGGARPGGPMPGQAPGNSGPQASDLLDGLIAALAAR